MEDKQENNKIKFEDFLKIDIRIGEVLECEKVEGTDKLLKLKVDFGEEIGIKQILTAMAQFYEPKDFIGKQMPFIVNLEERKIRGEISQGMVMAGDIGEDEKPVFLNPDSKINNGTKVL